MQNPGAGNSVSTRVSGLILVLISAVIFSTAGLFTKAVSADAWTIIFWRGLFAAGFTFIYILFQGSLKSEILCLDRVGYLAAVTSSVGSAAFISSFKLTTIANVSLIYAACPFVAALLGWLWMRERPAPTILIASVAAFGGVALIVSGSLGGLYLAGDLLALFMTFVMACILVIYRRYPQTPGPGPMALSCVFLLPVAAYFGDPFSAAADEIPVMATFGLVFAVASVTLVLGARHLPSSETALISSLEAPFAIILAWFILAEVPVLTTILGGAIILLAVFISQLLQGKNQP